VIGRKRNADGNTLWYDAVVKKMKNARMAFQFLEGDEKPPPGYKRIPMHMVFDIKMDFTRKARLVAGEHVMDTPSYLTYSSVVSRESVRIAFLLAALSDLEVGALTLVSNPPRPYPGTDP
jgi:hypothetical protein